MNKDTESKLDELLAKMPKRDYDLDAWLNEDETAEFDRIVNQRCSDGMCVDSLACQPQRHQPMLWRWVAAVACLLIIIGVGVTMKLTEEDNMQPQLSLAQPQGLLMQPQPTQAQSLPSLQGEGSGVGSETSKTLALENEKTIQPPLHPLGTPPLEGRGVATRTHHPSLITHHSSLHEDTLGSAIWQREENVVLALQMLSDCDQTIQREEQELRNDIIRATFNATPQPAKARLLLNDNGDYMVVEDNGPVIIAL